MIYFYWLHLGLFTVELPGNLWVTVLPMLPRRDRVQHVGLSVRPNRAWFGLGGFVRFYRWWV